MKEDPAIAQSRQTEKTKLAALSYIYVETYTRFSLWIITFKVAYSCNPTATSLQNLRNHIYTIGVKIRKRLQTQLAYRSIRGNAEQEHYVNGNVLHAVVTRLPLNQLERV